MDNTKHNAALLLTEIGKLLAAEQGATVTVEATKANFAAPAPAELVDRYREACDVVITGVGDCGSCSASAVADGIGFEQAGLPAAVICSDAFVVTADAMADLRGAPGYHYLRTAHPVAVLTTDQVRQRAKQLLPEVVAALTEHAAQLHQCSPRAQCSPRPSSTLTPRARPSSTATRRAGPTACRWYRPPGRWWRGSWLRPGAVLTK
jgi:hypothetical protein